MALALLWPASAVPQSAPQPSSPGTAAAAAAPASANIPASATAKAAPARLLERPAGGWVFDGLTEDPARVQYAYPSNLVDRGGQRGRTLIEGHLAPAAAHPPGPQKPPARPPLLVVNGNVLPLYTGEGGRYARPYVFGAGSNSIELRDALGRTVQRTQFIEANGLKTRARLRVTLAWDDPQAELDLHVLTPGGGHAFWAQPALAGGGGLDMDSVDGAGPEMFSMPSPAPGNYHVYVNYWGRFGDTGYHFDDNARKAPVITARISVVFDENTGAERRETYTVPVRKIGDLMRVRSFLR